MTFLKLHKGGVEVYPNFNSVVRIDHAKPRGSHIDFTDVDLEEVVDEAPDEIISMLLRTPQ